MIVEVFMYFFHLQLLFLGLFSTPYPEICFGGIKVFLGINLLNRQNSRSDVMFTP